MQSRHCPVVAEGFKSQGRPSRSLDILPCLPGETSLWEIPVQAVQNVWVHSRQSLLSTLAGQGRSISHKVPCTVCECCLCAGLYVLRKVEFMNAPVAMREALLSLM